MRTAIVCDSMSFYGGAERVIEQLLQLFPEADIFTTVDVLLDGERGFLGNRPVNSSFLQHVPRISRYYRKLFPIWPLAIESLDVSSYELIVSSHHSVAYGVLTRPGQVHVSYVHSPMRYAWDLQHEYLREAKLDRGVIGFLARAALHHARIWDYTAAQRPDAIAANSRFISERLRRSHRRTAEVIYPPVAVENFKPLPVRDDYYVSICRLVPYKRVDLLARAFSAMPHRRLKIIGDGPTRSRIELLAGPNVEVLGYLADAEAKLVISRARAFLYAGIEDFGIAAVEAQAAGLPVIAYDDGGVAETVLGIEHSTPTGLLFAHQTYEAVIEAVELFENLEHRIRPEYCTANAARFSSDRFLQEFRMLVERTISAASSKAAELHCVNSTSTASAAAPIVDSEATAAAIPGTAIESAAE